MEQDINEVKNFWEANPLWVGESKFKPGTFEFFEEHRQTVIDDCFAGKLDSRIFPKIEKNQKILDLGCGIGFWTVELLLKGYTNVMAADLTRNALTLTEKRLSAYGVIAELSIQNAENMTFKNSEFSHVNCLGVIHHSPNPESCIKEIARVLGAKGTACISVYYKNFFLRIWPLLKYPARIIMRILGGGLKGRGREN